MGLPHLKSWLALVIAGTVLIGGLGQLPSIEQSLQERRQAVMTFQPLTARVLTDDNMVDRMSKLPLRAQFLKVGWDHGILSVDLIRSRQDDWLMDLELLVLFSFLELHNVRQLLIRVYQNDGEKRTLLMAAETRRSEWSEWELEELQSPLFLLLPGWTEKIRLHITPAGRQKFTNSSNS